MLEFTVPESYQQSVELRRRTQTRSESDALRHFLTVRVSGAVERLFEVELFQSIAQCAKGDAEQLRGGCLVLAGMFQCLDEGVFLDGIHVGIQRHSTVRRFL